MRRPQYYIHRYHTDHILCHVTFDLLHYILVEIALFKMKQIITNSNTRPTNSSSSEIMWSKVRTRVRVITELMNDDRLGMPSKKKTPYGGTLSQPHITPSPPSKVGTKIEGTFFGF